MVKVKINMTGWVMAEHGIPDSRLTIIEQAEDYVVNGKHYAQWLCECSCEKHGRIIALGTDVRTGDVRSCGCLWTEYIDSQRKNSVHNERLYHVWCGMKRRCYSSNSTSYKNYGSRGIKVCKEWESSYNAFKTWAIANGYDEQANRGQCTIERIDVNGDYCPENCKFANATEQANNRRSNRLVTIDGETKNITEWAKTVGLTDDCISARIKLGWSEYDAVMIPKGGKYGAC